MVNRRGVALSLADDPSSREMAIAIDQGATWHGRFTIVDGPDESARNVTGATCDEVARSLSIFVSLAVGKKEPPTSKAPSLPIGPSGFMPMAPPPAPPAADLLDGRFDLGIEQGAFVGNGGDSWGVGLRGTYFATGSIGFQLEGDVYRVFSGQKFQPVGRIAGGLEIEIAKHQKPLIDLFHTTYDLYFLTQGGVLFSRPTPLGADYAYKPGFDFDAGLGFRYFMNPSFALTVETSFDLFSREAAPAITGMPTTREVDGASTTWVGLTFYFGDPGPP